MIRAIGKYNSSTTVIETDWREVEEADKPTITLCEVNQFDLEAAEVHGFYSLAFYIHGLTFHKSQALPGMTWEGISNLTNNEIIRAIFKANYSGVEYKKNKIAPEDKFMLPYGHCKNLKISNFNEDWALRILIHDQKKFAVYITNPLETTNFSISKTSMRRDAITNDGKLGGKFYIIDLVEEHWNKKDCHDYGEEFESFTQCEEYHEQQMFLTEIGCIPPWFSNSRQCKEINQFNVNISKNFKFSQYSTFTEGFPKLNFSFALSIIAEYLLNDFLELSSSSFFKLKKSKS